MVEVKSKKHLDPLVMELKESSLVSQLSLSPVGGGGMRYLVIKVGSALLMWTT